MNKGSGEHPPLITLTTDFGLRDEYVGTVKGVILLHCREAVIVDLTHGIEPQNITEAAMTIGASFQFFPQGTVHMVVVDPGVGSNRRILAAKAEGYFFVAPDNGVLTHILTEDHLPEVYSITNRDLFSETISNSFQGRDIMAPVVARMACGMDISQVGPRLSVKECCRIPLPKAMVTDTGLIGEVIHIDHFGNLRTSITAADISLIPPNVKMEISVGGHLVTAISTAYTAKERVIAHIDSRNCLEIALKDGDAARELDCRIGERVTISTSWQKKE